MKSPYLASSFGEEQISEGIRYVDMVDDVWYVDGASVFLLENDINKYYLRVDVENNKQGDAEAVAVRIKNLLNAAGVK